MKTPANSICSPSEIREIIIIEDSAAPALEIIIYSFAFSLLRERESVF